jgi:hypothetical protein
MATISPSTTAFVTFSSLPIAEHKIIESLHRVSPARNETTLAVLKICESPKAIVFYFVNPIWTVKDVPPTHRNDRTEFWGKIRKHERTRSPRSKETKANPGPGEVFAEK